MATDGADADELLAGLDEQQRAAVTDAGGCRCSSWPGPGRARRGCSPAASPGAALTGADDPRRLLALTFTRSAARRAARPGCGSSACATAVRAGTFHAVAWAELRARRGRAPPPAAGAARPARPRSSTGRAGERRPRRPSPRSPSSWRGPGPGWWPPTTTRRPPAGTGRHARSRPRRRRAGAPLRARRSAAAASSTSTTCSSSSPTPSSRRPRLAAAQRWRTAHLYVDEYQDINPLQDRLLEAWRGGRPDAVRRRRPEPGDLRLERRRPRLLLDRFVERHPGAARRRHRPQLPVVARRCSTLANALLDAGGAAAACACGPCGPRARSRSSPATTTTTPRPAPSPGPASTCAARARRGRTRPCSPAPTRQLDAVEAALGAVGVPIRRAAAGSPFVELAAVRAALDELAGPTLDADLAAVAGRRGPTTSDVDADDDELADGTSSWPTRYRARRRRPDGPRFRAGCGDEADDGAGADGVELRTFHGAKGLEWPIVHVVRRRGRASCRSPGAAPDGALAEERRLLYVACTRAERVLRITWAAARRFGDRHSRCRAGRRRTSPRWRRRSRRCGRAAPADWREHLPRRRAGAAGRRRPRPTTASRRRCGRGADAGRGPPAWRRRACSPTTSCGRSPTPIPADADAVAAVAGTGHLVARRPRRRARSTRLREDRRACGSTLEQPSFDRRTPTRSPAPTPTPRSTPRSPSCRAPAGPRSCRHERRRRRRRARRSGGGSRRRCARPPAGDRPGRLTWVDGRAARPRRPAGSTFRDASPTTTPTGSRATGSYRFRRRRPSGTGAISDGRPRVKAPLVGRAVEDAIVSGLEDQLRSEVAVVESFVGLTAGRAGATTAWSRSIRFVSTRRRMAERRRLAVSRRRRGRRRGRPGRPDADVDDDLLVAST